MSETFFIGDTHFGHKGIIQFSGTRPYRPFDTIEEHDAELIKRWNKVVGKNDRVFVLGDFCFGKRNLPIANELNGTKKLIMGNHDCYASTDYLQYFEKLYGCCEYKGTILSHMPVHENQFPRYFMNIHGHMHEKVVMKGAWSPTLEPDRRYFNCSAEQINLTPIPYDEILSEWAKNH